MEPSRYLIERARLVAERAGLGSIAVVPRRGGGSRVRIPLRGVRTTKYAYLVPASGPGFDVRLYPADTLTQARLLYRSRAATEGLLQLASEGWELRTHFHLGYIQRGMSWTTTKLLPTEYVHYWIRNIDRMGVIPRDQWDQWIESWISDGIMSEEDRMQFQIDFRDTKRESMTPRPGMLLVRPLPLSAATTEDLAADLGRWIREASRALSAPK